MHKELLTKQIEELTEEEQAIVSEMIYYLKNVDKSLYYDFMKNLQDIEEKNQETK